MKHVFLFFLLFATTTVTAQGISKVISEDSINRLRTTDYATNIHRGDSLLGLYRTQPFMVLENGKIYRDGLSEVLIFFLNAVEEKPGDDYAQSQASHVKTVMDLEAKIEMEVQYQKVLEAAQRYYAKGNTVKALELFQRALTFRPNDDYALKRIKELEKEQKR